LQDKIAEFGRNISHSSEQSGKKQFHEYQQNKLVIFNL